eukprot:TRINITY_DN8941_c0_g1_i2.p1 TRINITY_DN8941_c0_g1~~TRINITY_DN8941_c0_g1_i2.p1  ORF type:complete len:708 (+),score=162.27 TRINITY_DN8941_c0_g1_i2:255-2378(+)
MPLSSSERRRRAEANKKARLTPEEYQALLDERKAKNRAKYAQKMATMTDDEKAALKIVQRESSKARRDRKHNKKIEDLLEKNSSRTPDAYKEFCDSCEPVDPNKNPDMKMFKCSKTAPDGGGWSCVRNVVMIPRAFAIMSFKDAFEHGGFITKRYDFLAHGKCRHDEGNTKGCVVPHKNFMRRYFNGGRSVRQTPRPMMYVSPLRTYIRVDALFLHATGRYENYLCRVGPVVKGSLMENSSISHKCHCGACALREEHLCVELFWYNLHRSLVECASFETCCHYPKCIFEDGDEKKALVYKGPFGILRSPDHPEGLCVHVKTHRLSRVFNGGDENGNPAFFDESLRGEKGAFLKVSAEEREFNFTLRNNSATKQGQVEKPVPSMEELHDEVVGIAALHSGEVLDDTEYPPPAPGPKVIVDAANADGDSQDWEDWTPREDDVDTPDLDYDDVDASDRDDQSLDPNEDYSDNDYSRSYRDDSDNDSEPAEEEATIYDSEEELALALIRSEQEYRNSQAEKRISEFLEEEKASKVATPEISLPVAGQPLIRAAIPANVSPPKPSSVTSGTSSPASSVSLSVSSSMSSSSSSVGTERENNHLFNRLAEFKQKVSDLDTRYDQIKRRMGETLRKIELERAAQFEHFYTDFPQLEKSSVNKPAPKKPAPTVAGALSPEHLEYYGAKYNVRVVHPEDNEPKKKKKKVRHPRRTLF